MVDRGLLYRDPEEIMKALIHTGQAFEEQLAYFKEIEKVKKPVCLLLRVWMGILGTKTVASTDWVVRILANEGTIDYVEVYPNHGCSVHGPEHLPLSRHTRTLSAMSLSTRNGHRLTRLGSLAKAGSSWQNSYGKGLGRIFESVGRLDPTANDRRPDGLLHYSYIYSAWLRYSPFGRGGAEYYNEIIYEWGRENIVMEGGK